MARRIHKETLKIEDALDKPVMMQWRKGAKLVHVGYIKWGHIDFWLEVDPDIDEFEGRAFQVYPTGGDIYPEAEYVATSVQKETDHLGFTTTSVWHVYDRTIV